MTEKSKIITKKAKRIELQRFSLVIEIDGFYNLILENFHL
jgi:hypothetical protein